MKKCAIDSDQIEFLGFVFVKKRCCDDQHRAVVNRAEPRHEAKGDERRKRQEMQELSETQTARDPQFHNKRSNPFTPVEIVVLRGINQIESRHPANYTRRKHKRRKIDVSRLGDPRADRSNRQRQSEKEMRRSLRKLLDYKAERILFAHGTPILSGASDRLQKLLDSDL